jgi:hypothetical protein
MSMRTRHHKGRFVRRELAPSNQSGANIFPSSGFAEAASSKQLAGNNRGTWSFVQFRFIRRVHEYALWNDDTILLSKSTSTKYGLMLGY